MLQQNIKEDFKILFFEFYVFINLKKKSNLFNVFIYIYI